MDAANEYQPQPSRLVLKPPIISPSLEKQNSFSDLPYRVNQNVILDKELPDESSRVAFTVLSAIAARPSLLDTMPILWRDMEQFAAWEKKVGLDKTYFLNDVWISMEFLQKTFSFSPRLMDISRNGEFNRNSKNISFGKFLEAIQFVQDEAMFFQSIDTKSHESLLMYHPEWAPQEPTMIIPLYDEPQGLRSQYFGKLGNKHVILLNLSSLQDQNAQRLQQGIPWDNPYRMRNIIHPIESEMVLLHEKVHQRHNEDQQFLSLDEFFKETEATTFTPSQVFDRIMEKFYVIVEKGTTPDAPTSPGTNLGLVALEGTAVGVELDIGEKRKEVEIEKGNTKDAQEYARFKKWRLKILQLHRRWEKEQNVTGIDPYSVGTTQLVRNLLSTYRSENLSRVIKRINILKSCEITSEDPQFKQMIDHPELLPGIEGFLINAE